jgi:serine protease Do
MSKKIYMCSNNNEEKSNNRRRIIMYDENEYNVEGSESQYDNATVEVYERPSEPSNQAFSLVLTQALHSPKLMKAKCRRFSALLVVMCMIGSAIFGFGGTYLANSLNGSNSFTAESTAASNNDASALIIQSVMPTTTNNAESEIMSIENVVVNVKHSVVEIQTERVSTSRFMREFISTGAGSGVIISTDGYIVTNDHVISGAQAITVRLSNEQEYEATLIGTDPQTDLAVLKINATGLQPAIMGHSSGLLVGQTAVAIGNPLGKLGGTVTSGIISALDREITIDGETMSLLQTDAAVNPGNSGGGLFNLYGELIGVVNAKSSGSEIEGLGFAIPIDTARIVIEQLIEYGFVRGRIDTGFTLVDIQDAFTAMSYRIQHLGLYISHSVNENFQSGDRITAVDGQPVTNLTDWNRQMNKYKIGDTVTITIIRNDISLNHELIMSEKTA